MPFIKLCQEWITTSSSIFYLKQTVDIFWLIAQGTRTVITFLPSSTMSISTFMYGKLTAKCLIYNIEFQALQDLWSTFCTRHFSKEHLLNNGYRLHQRGSLTIGGCSFTRYTLRIDNMFKAAGIRDPLHQSPSSAEPLVNPKSLVDYVALQHAVHKTGKHASYRKGKGKVHFSRNSQHPDTQDGPTWFNNDSVNLTTNTSYMPL